MYLRDFGNRPVSRRRKRSAAAAVEMAIILPVLVIMALGMFELSRGVMVRQTLTDAARKGCRTGILPQYGNNDISNDATGVMRDNGFTSTQFNPSSNVGAINITVTDPSGNALGDALNAPAGSMVSVQIAIPATSVNWLTYLFLTRDTVESDFVVMMKQ
jgi:Flp pilus assembly protein TadG